MDPLLAASCILHLAFYIWIRAFFFAVFAAARGRRVRPARYGSLQLHEKIYLIWLEFYACMYACMYEKAASADRSCRWGFYSHFVMGVSLPLKSIVRDDGVLHL